MDSKVFGIGLSKTGTTSLCEALRILGYKTRHFPFTFLQKERGKLFLNMKKVERFDALADTPIALFYKELDKKFPGSKFILTTRQVDSWLNSAKRFIWIGKYLPKNHKINLLHMKLYNTIPYEKEKFKKAYERHTKDVKNYFKNRKKDLLILDICKGQGWKEICEFLNKPIPKGKFPFFNKGHHRVINRFFRKLRLPKPFKIK